MTVDPSPIRGVEAVIFDMDGTLVDSEPFTAVSVEALLEAEGIEDPELDPTCFFGRTWQAIADELIARHPQLAGRCSPEILDARFLQCWRETPPPPIAGALSALAAAKACGPTALATSSHRSAVDILLAQLDLERWLDVVVSAEDFARSKPDPECFLLAADRLGVAPQACLVFEDSLAGLQAARAAGMQAVAITHRTADIDRARGLSALVVPDYRSLPADFFSRSRAQ
jgi:HAD superfamily hydrolase (TIGR01509 family)